MNCHICGRLYSRKSSLERHIRVLHNEDHQSFFCELCNARFRYKETLKRHRIEKHVHQLPHNFNIEVKPFVCDVCNAKFTRKDGLSFHMSRQHTLVYEDFYECDICKKKYVHKPSLRTHIQRIHLKGRLDQEQHHKEYVCVLCEENLMEECTIIHHFQTVHDLCIEVEPLSFPTKEDFMLWKKKMEKQTFCSYIKRHSTQYQCHRSGFYLPVSDRKRRAAKRGSKKMNGYCPSNIKYTAKKDGSYTVRFVKTHVGHPVNAEELAYVRFSSEDRDKIAVKITSNEPVMRIVRDLRKDSTEEEEHLEKAHLLTKQDILNVSITQNLHRINDRCVADTDSNDILCVDSYITANATSVLYCKKPGELDPLHPDLHEDDFVLVIMKQQQLEKLLQYGFNVIAVDSNRNLGEENFLLFTIAVLDHYNEGYPCCFMITNLDEPTVVDIMFSCVKEEVGEMRTRCLIVDMKQTYIDSWLRVMNNEPQFKLFCSWHVQKAWTCNLSKIKSKEKKKAVKVALHDLHHESNIAEFHHKLHAFLNDDDEMLNEFFGYFHTHFVTNVSQWAYCYRQHAGINTNMSIKRLHRTLKQSYTNGSKVPHVHECLKILDLFIRDKTREELVCRIKGKIPSKERLIRKAHNEAVINVDLMNVQEEDDNHWIVETCIDNSENHIVSRNEEPICSFYDSGTTCKIICQDCNACVHQFLCTCQENSIQSNMCVHIHLVVLKQLTEIVYVKPEEATVDVNDVPKHNIAKIVSGLHELNEEDTDATEDIHQETIKVEFDVNEDLTQEDTDRMEEEILEEYKTKLVGEYNELMGHVDNVEKAKTLEDMLVQLQHKMLQDG